MNWQIFYFTDLKRLNRIAMKALNSGMIIVGGGVIKHHICNANLMVRRFSLIHIKYIYDNDNDVLL